MFQLELRLAATFVFFDRFLMRTNGILKIKISIYNNSRVFLTLSSAIKWSSLARAFRLDCVSIKTILRCKNHDAEIWYLKGKKFCGNKISRFSRLKFYKIDKLQKLQIIFFRILLFDKKKPKTFYKIWEPRKKSFWSSAKLKSRESFFPYEVAFLMATPCMFILL